MTILFFDTQTEASRERVAALQKIPGWKVSNVSSMAEARFWLTNATALDLLIAEAIPATGSETGFELRDAALARFPAAHVLFTTRYDLTGFEEQIAGWPVLIDAPYSVEKLVARAQAALTQAASVQGEPPPFLSSGTLLGNYQVLDRLMLENESETYRAIQVTVQRPVVLVLLRPDRLNQPEVVKAFKERERLKASISHPRVAPLYEAGSVNGLLFYTRELPRGRSLEELLAAREHLSERKLTELLYGVAEVMDYAVVQRGHRHRRLYARDIYLDAENQASIVNIFRPTSSSERDPMKEVRALLELVKPLAAEGKARGLLNSLIEADHDWESLLMALEEVRDAMRERSIIRRIEAEEGGGRKRSVPWWAWVATLAALVVVFALGGLAGKNGGTRSAGLKEQEMIMIPAGTFIYQKNERRRLPTFWISKYEVTIGQYGEFLKALEEGKATAYDHPDQPKSKTSHLPSRWEDIYAAAQAGATFNGHPLRLDTPVTQVDWWDAYAYAKWKGHRLPTEEEWEKAARGEKGWLFPWGNDSKSAAANLGDDYQASGKGGGKDGYNFWAPAGRKTDDISPYGVCDLAGNVAEWTSGEHQGDFWTAHPDYPDLRVPVARGGHFALKSSRELLTTRFFAESASEATLARGFRTVSDQPPES